MTQFFFANLLQRCAKLVSSLHVCPCTALLVFLGKNFHISAHTVVLQHTFFLHYFLFDVLGLFLREWLPREGTKVTSGRLDSLHFCHINDTFTSTHPVSPVCPLQDPLHFLIHTPSSHVLSLFFQPLLPISSRHLGLPFALVVP